MEDAENSAGVRPGDVLAGKYRVEKVLGAGGMGVVVAAHHVQLDEKVAIKFLLPAMLSNQEVIGRFAREARAAVKIKSEHVARVSDVGTLENGAPYMVMEFLEGGDLADWIHRQGPLPLEQAVDFVVQACVGVASAHGIGIVHRDLKPANLFCLRGNDGQFVIKVLDFGISKITNLSVADAAGAVTHTTAVMGSPFYMSPEQMQSAKEVDTRTDIWALGVVLYELLTGTTPFAGSSFSDVAIKVATASFAPVRSYRPDFPPGLEAVVLKCLEKDKNRRYANVAELALALTDFGSKQSRPSIDRIVRIIQASGLSTSALALPPSPVVARTPAPPAQVLESAETAIGTMAPSSNTTHGVAARPRARAAVIIGLLGAASIAAAVGWMILPKRSPSPAPNSPVTAAPRVASSSPAPAPAPEPVVVEVQKPAEAPAATGAASTTVGTVPPQASGVAYAGPPPRRAPPASSGAPLMAAPILIPQASSPRTAPAPSPPSSTQGDALSRLRPKQ